MERWIVRFIFIFYFLFGIRWVRIEVSIAGGKAEISWSRMFQGLYILYTFE